MKFLMALRKHLNARGLPVLLAFWKHANARGFIVLLAVVYTLLMFIEMALYWGEAYTFTVGWRHLWAIAVTLAYFRAGVVYARKGVAHG